MRLRADHGRRGLRPGLACVLMSVIALGLVGLALLVLELAYQPGYDQSHPDYDRYVEVFARLRPKLAARGPTKEDHVDFAPLHNGDWKMACLFGGYTTPVEAMQAL